MERSDLENERAKKLLASPVLEFSTRTSPQRIAERLPGLEGRREAIGAVKNERTDGAEAREE